MLWVLVKCKTKKNYHPRYKFPFTVIVNLKNSLFCYPECLQEQIYSALMCEFVNEVAIIIITVLSSV